MPRSPPRARGAGVRQHGTVSSNPSALDPSTAVDPRAAYDALRERCPVARGDDGALRVRGHAEVRAVALDDETFSSAVSRYLQVPNGLDGDEHTPMRALIDSYLGPDRMAQLVPVFLDAAASLVTRLAVPGPVDAVDLGATFAVRSMSAWLGWPTALEDELISWVAANQAATRSGEQGRTAEVAEWFDAIVRGIITERRADGTEAPADVTTELLHDRSLGRALSDEEVVSILRNWTGGDLSSLALCTGVILTHIADHAELQERLRSGVRDGEVDAAIDEILRIDSPFVSNRRVATRATVLGGQEVAEGDRLIINWTAANRDPVVFGDPDRFDPRDNAAHNLVWGIGRHVCPGRGLATLELRILTRAVLGVTSWIDNDPERPHERARPPVGGFAAAPLRLR